MYNEGMGIKKKNKNEGTPFDELEKEIEKGHDPIDLQSKVRTFEAKRNSKRETINGAAIIYDLREKTLSKAEFRNLSHDGVSFEIWPVEINVNDDVYVHLHNAINLGMVLCTVQWVVNIEGHRRNHKLVGLKFKKLTKLKQKKLAEYLDNLQIKRQHDPFYAG